MDAESLGNKILELKKELIKINAQIAIGTVPKNPGQVRNIKKTIAKILTIQNQKKAAAIRQPGNAGKNDKEDKKKA